MSKSWDFFCCRIFVPWNSAPRNKSTRKLLSRQVEIPSADEVALTLLVFSPLARSLGSVRSLPSGISRQWQLHGGWQPGAGQQQLPVSESLHAAQRLQEPRAHQRQLVLRLLRRCVWRLHPALHLRLLPPTARIRVWFYLNCQSK